MIPANNALRNTIEETVLSYLHSNALIEKGMHVCVCFSGGVDSSVLLRILLSVREELGIHLSACHFNHQIRGENADRDEAFCASICRELCVPFFRGGADVPALARECGKSLEEAARDARYAWFSSLGKKERIDRFATAHHKNDQAETVVFHLLRGTTVAGLRGIPPRRGDIIRPLLGLSRAEIEAYAREHEIPFCMDETNASECHTRNYIRHTLFPAMERVNPAAMEAITRLSRYAMEDEEAFNALLPPFANPQPVAGLSTAILRRVAARNFTAYTGGSLCYRHLDAICLAARENRDAVIGLTGGYRAVLTDGMLRYEVVSPVSLPPLESGVLHEGETLLCGRFLRITVQKGEESFLGAQPEVPAPCASDSKFIYNLSTEIPLSCDGIYGMIRYRCRLAGDRLHLRGVNRSVKKLFSESRVPVSLRSYIPVFYDEAGILCIPFVGVADRAYVPEGKAPASLRIRVEIADRQTERW